MNDFLIRRPKIRVKTEDYKPAVRPAPAQAPPDKPAAATAGAG
uniref:Uncharacterized protein n=1 Tax=Arundo donax TaxID=35708 RepID=A0A0A8YVN4_ARUDO